MIAMLSDDQILITTLKQYVQALRAEMPTTLEVRIKSWLQPLAEHLPFWRPADAIIASPIIYPPVSPDVIEMAEHRLGFQLPTLLRMIYLHVGNGGFGPGCGLIGLPGGATLYGQDVVGLYLQDILQPPLPPYRPWPRRFMMIGDWGCNITSVMDVTDEQFPIIRFWGDRYEVGEPWESAMTPEAMSLNSWLAEWLQSEMRSSE
jgi:hypothetical protein